MKVFNALRDGLSDEWEAFHSVSWVDPRPAEGSTDGEIDFVLCHPEQGILCLEVKGGGIECQPRRVVPAHEGKRERIKDPFKQALDHRYDLERKIEEQSTGGRSRQACCIAHALGLP